MTNKKKFKAPKENFLRTGKTNGQTGIVSPMKLQKVTRRKKGWVGGPPKKKFYNWEKKLRGKQSEGHTKEGA